MNVLLDSSFIISCVRGRIDFISQLQEQGFRIQIPREVLQEMKDLRFKNKTSREDKLAIDMAMEMIEKNKVKKISMGEGKVDEWLIKKGIEGYYIATLDNVIKRAVPRKVIIFKAKGMIGVEG
ncbi:hypothetical protein AUJ84_01765 [Candidatus Pacearchaeota archaeon CG1_02_32_132]|nr:MAG: hypothetical protein AUJ84_01765 [Candidatus Pacearchaeota archaeon CG1_02_32_132]